MLPLMTAGAYRFYLSLITVAAAGLFLVGISWGLPNRDADEHLFGGRKAWTGRQIMQLAGAWDETAARGADIAMHPLPGVRPAPLLLNDSDAKRAEIVRRYRLYSCQPDEMITFRSLSRMKPGRFDLDPRLYQYGGLWIYPVGALLKIASAFHLVTLRADLVFYLDHPEAFGRFYVIARCYSVAWGLLGVWVVAALARQLTGKFSTGLTAAAAYACMPVVIDLAHEAKPHLAGAVLCLATVFFAQRYVKFGKKRSMILASICAGAAMGMVLTGYVAFAILVAMHLLRSNEWKARLRLAATSFAIGIGFFALTNPYVPFNMMFRPQVMHSNVGNYGTFYQPKLTWDAIKVSIGGLIEGASFGLLAIGFLGGVYILFHRQFRSSVGMMLWMLVAVVLAQFVLLADGKTAEYARFALLPDIVLAIFAAAFIDQLQFNARERNLASALLVVSALFFASRYELNFLRDEKPDSTRQLAANSIDSLKSQSQTLKVWAEPAPYAAPPVDLFYWKILLLPRGSDGSGTSGIGVRATDNAPPSRPESPMSWANKPFEISRQ